MPATAPLSIRPNPGSRSVAARRDFIPPRRGETGNLVCGSSSVPQVTRARCEGVKELGKKNGGEEVQIRSLLHEDVMATRRSAGLPGSRGRL